MSYITYSVITHRKLWNAQRHTHLSVNFSIHLCSILSLSLLFRQYSHVLPLGGTLLLGAYPWSHLRTQFYSRSPFFFLFPLPSIPVFFPGSKRLQLSEAFWRIPELKEQLWDPTVHCSQFIPSWNSFTATPSSLSSHLHTFSDRKHTTL